MTNVTVDGVEFGNIEGVVEMIYKTAYLFPGDDFKRYSPYPQIMHCIMGVLEDEHFDDSIPRLLSYLVRKMIDCDVIGGVKTYKIRTQKDVINMIEMENL